jgi:hypothetical protein
LGDRRGVVFAEFVIAFTPFFLLFLAVVQLCLLFAADVVVQHAAVSAARTAAVTLDDDPCFHEGEPRGILSGVPRGAGDRMVRRALARLGIGDERGSDGSGLGKPGGARLTRIRNAAYLPLASISPTRRDVASMLPWATTLAPSLGSYDVARAVGEEPVLRVLSGLSAYDRVAAAITFPEQPGSDALRDPASDPFGVDAFVTVRVTYLFPCTVPIVRTIMCSALSQIVGMPDWERVSSELRAASTLSEAVRRADATWTRERERLEHGEHVARELRHAEASRLLPALAASRNRFIVLRAEASLPNQGAAYRYPSELGKARCKGMKQQGGAS